MNKENQITLIEKFITSTEENLIINQVNDELGIFYLGLIKYYTDKQSININIEDNNDNTEMENDLFGLKEIKIFYITSTKKLASILNAHCKNYIY